MKFKITSIIIFLFTLNSLTANESNTELLSTGAITGRVTSAATGESLPGATIKVNDLKLYTTSDIYGSYRITRIPAGEYSISISYMGYNTKTLNVNIETGKTKNVNIELTESTIEVDEVVIQEFLRGQARALNQQKEAESIRSIISWQQIERFPDLSIAESAKRIPGISTDYRRGESSEILLRGLPGNFHVLTINNQRVASSDEVTRSTDASIINSDMVSSIEVIKSITPDMDADATSGVINIITRRPVGNEKILHINAGSGYNNLSSLPMWIGSATYGQRNGKVDWILSGSYQKDQRAVEDIRHDWGVEDFGDGDEDVLARLTSSHYQTDRQRAGITGQMDYNINERSVLYFMGHFNNFNDYETRNETVYRIDNGDYESPNYVTGARYEKDLREQRRITNLYSLNAGGKHDLNILTVDYNLGYSFGSYDIPLREQYVFRHDDKPDYIIDLSDRQFGNVEFDGDFSPNNYESLIFRQYDRRLDYAEDKDMFSTLNISIPYQIAGNYAIIKLGGKYWNKQKDRETLQRRWDNYNGEDDLTMAQFAIDTDGNIVGNRYDMAGDIDWEEGRNFFNNNIDDFSLDENRAKENSDPYNYSAMETIIAAYGLTDITLGNLSVNAGARMEHASNNYKGNKVVFDDEGDYQATQEIESDTKKQLHIFPMINFKYKANEISNIRLGYTHTIVRPNFNYIIPFEIVNHDKQTVVKGNPELQPSTSINLDLAYERYLPYSGLLSTGVFYKNMSDFIFLESTVISGDTNAGYSLEMPKNGESAYIYGVEFAWQQQLKFLPGFLSDFGIYSNYTYTHSDAKIIVPEERRIPLPQQAPHVFNAALSYDKGGFSGQISYTFRDTWLHSVGVQDRAPSVSNIDDVFLDRYFMKSGQLDLALSYNFTKFLKIYANFNNLTGESHMQYFYDPVYPYRNSLFSWWCTFGLKYQL